jgi:hypothetical protein
MTIGMVVAVGVHLELEVEEVNGINQMMEIGIQLFLEQEHL